MFMTYEQIAANVEHDESLDWFNGSDCSHEDEIRMLANEARPLVYAHLRKHAKFFVTPEGIQWEPELLEVIRKFTGEIDQALELSDQPDSMWKQFELGGDNDVDYNGSYLADLVNILEAVTVQ